MLCMLLLSACSGIKIMYDRLDWIIPWYLDDYVSLGPDQEARFNDQLKNFLKWHRQQQLPEYANFLDWVAASAEDGLDGIEIDTIFREMRQLGEVLFIGVEKPLQDLLRTMDDAQVAELMRNLADDNTRYREKYVETSADEQRQKRKKEMQESLEKWVGPLDEDQIQLIQEWSQRYYLMGPEYLQSRIEWQQKLQQLLLRRNAAVDLSAEIKQLLSPRDNNRSEQFRLKHSSNESYLRQLNLELDQSLSKQQRLKMISRLKSIAQDFRELADNE